MKSKKLLIGLSIATVLVAAPVVSGVVNVNAATNAPAGQFSRMRRNSRPQRMSHFNMSKKLAGLSKFKHLKSNHSVPTQGTPKPNTK